MQEGKCIILSAPSGAGKTTLVRHLLSEIPELSFSISACTRSPRGKEKNGIDYYFLKLEEFKERIEADAFVEWEEVYTDNYYGTLKSEVERIWSEGKQLIFDVDVVGGLNLKEYFGDKALAIFVMPPDLPSLEARLRSRGTDSEDKIAQRLQKAKQELITADQFDHIILNDELNKAKQEVLQLVKSFLEV